MEFPELGKHCNNKDCNLLDFLPIKCNACQLIFCSSHYQYEKHDCQKKHERNVQVPVCPLCQEPIPTPRDVSADLTVSEHMDRFCKSEKTKIYTNRCSFRNCKKKELVPFNCSVCKLNFCLKHRHTNDHKCEGTSAGQRNLAAQAALRRAHQQSNNSNRTPTNASENINFQAVQGTMSEDEALARALQLSMEEEARRNVNRNAPRVTVGGSNNTSTKDKCAIS